jgi:prohibitin 2
MTCVVCLLKAQTTLLNTCRILTERARFFDIILDDVSITQLTFSKVYEAAVESKQVAQQEAERAKFVVGDVWMCWEIIEWHDK